MTGKQSYLKAAVLTILLVFGSSVCAEDLSGTYRGRTTTVTVKKIKEAWKITCSDDKYEQYNYYALAPEKKNDSIGSMKLVCLPGEHVTKNVYSVSIKNNRKRKSECPLIREFIAVAKPDGILELSGKHATGRLVIEGDTAGIGMPLSMERMGCTYLTTENYKKQ